MKNQISKISSLARIIAELKSKGIYSAKINGIRCKWDALSIATDVADMIIEKINKGSK